MKCRPCGTIGPALYGMILYKIIHYISRRHVKLGRKKKKKNNLHAVGMQHIAKTTGCIPKECNIGVEETRSAKRHISNEMCKEYYNILGCFGDKPLAIAHELASSAMHENDACCTRQLVGAAFMRPCVISRPDDTPRVSPCTHGRMNAAPTESVGNIVFVLCK